MEGSTLSSCVENSENHEISLIPVLDLCAASPLAGELTAHRGEDLIIDASNVERIGAQCVQVLLSAVNTWDADGNMLTITNVSSAFSETLSELGVQLQKSTAHEGEACL
jgi:chemotaxis protein CheX